ncbi:MAG: hypothetical protein ABSE73_14120 [Planctomycetota bacterium]
MTDAPKKRPWFQYHLSTAVVLMFVAGGIMALNWFRGSETGTYTYDVSGAVFGPAIGTLPQHGWPFRFTDSRVEYFDVIYEVPVPGATMSLPVQTPCISYRWLVADIAVALTILLATGIALEWRIRRRERRQ